MLMPLEHQFLLKKGDRRHAPAPYLPYHPMAGLESVFMKLFWIYYEIFRR